MKFSSLNRMLDRYFQKTSGSFLDHPQSQHDGISWLLELVGRHKSEETLSTDDMLSIAGEIKPIWEKLQNLTRNRLAHILKVYFFERQKIEIDQGEQYYLGCNGEMLILFAQIMERISAENIELDMKDRSKEDQEKYGFIQTFHNVMVQAITRIDEEMKKVQQRNGR